MNAVYVAGSEEPIDVVAQPSYRHAVHPETAHAPS